MDKFEELRKGIDALEAANGVSMADVLLFPEPLSSTLSALVRKRALSLHELSKLFALELAQTEIITALLLEKGILQLKDQEPGQNPVYRVRFARRRRNKMPTDIWQALDDL